MPVYDKKFLLCEAQVMGDTADEYSVDPDSNTSIDFGVTTPGVAMAGKFGLHVVVTTTLTQTSLNSGCEIWLCSDSGTSPTGKVMGRFFARAALVAGKHYFIPCPPTGLLRYARALFKRVSENAVAGAYTMWLGPDEDGTE